MLKLDRINNSKNEVIYKHNGVPVGKVKISIELNSVYIQQIAVKKEFRRNGIGTFIVKDLLSLYKKPLYGFVCTYYAARFWGQFDTEMPLSLNDDELDEWCHHDGWFNVKIS